MRAWTLFKTWTGAACRWLGVPVPWPILILSEELMIEGGKVWASRVTAGPFAGGWQFPPELCTPGMAPPRPFQSPNVSAKYTPRRGGTQCTLARVVAVKRIRFKYYRVPFSTRTQYLMDVAFSDRIGDPDGTGTGVDGITIGCCDADNPTEALLRWFARARLSHLLG